MEYAIADISVDKGILPAVQDGGDGWLHLCNCVQMCSLQYQFMSNATSVISEKKIVLSFLFLASGDLALITAEIRNLHASRQVLELIIFWRFCLAKKHAYT